jgi:hypothetical protein
LRETSESLITKPPELRKRQHQKTNLLVQIKMHLPTASKLHHSITSSKKHLFSGTNKASQACDANFVISHGG